MKTEAVKREDGYHITFTGKLDLLKTNYLRNVLLQEFKNQRVYFELKFLSFVGSNGILHFFMTVDEVAGLGNIQFQINGLSEDFKKIVKSYNYPRLNFDFISPVATVEKEGALGELIEDEWLETTNPDIQKPEPSTV